MYTLKEGKGISIRITESFTIAEDPSATWRITAAQAFQSISQMYVIVLQQNTEMCQNHRIS